MTDKDEALIVLGYNSWLIAQADKLGVNFDDVGEVVRKYENRMHRFKQKILKEIALPTNDTAAHSHD